MLSFLRNEISEDYESFSNASRNFMGKSDDIRISMEQLQKITEQYEESLKSINDVMQSVSATSEEASTEETFQNISGMNKELSAYGIDMGGGVS